MNTNPHQSEQATSKIHPFSYFLVASGGGVVGTDYANWLELDPIIGTFFGVVVSMILLRLANHLARDPGGKIRKKCMEIGGCLGLFLGATIIGIHSEQILGWIIGGAIGAVVGYKLGEIAAALISMLGLGILLLSQGPIGFAVRTFILNLN